MTNITLHAATEQVRELLAQIDPDTGELPAELDQAREVVATKALAVVAYIVESGRQIDYLRAYAKDIADRATTAEKRIAWLRRHLSEHMKQAGIVSLTDERGLFTAKLDLERDASVDVFDAAQIPADYLREIPAKHEPDKALIKRALSDGFEVPGARIVKRDRLTTK